MNPEENKNVHLIFDCDDTLINAHQLINHLMDSPDPRGIASPSLLTLCVSLVNNGQLASITINTHQDIGTIQQRLNGMDGFLTRPPTETISWNVAKSLKDAIKAQTGKDIDIHICLQSDIYPALATAEDPDPAPHTLGYTAKLLQDHQETLSTQKDRLQNETGEMRYMRSGLGEGEKATQTAFVLAHIKKLQPEGVRHVLYFDDTKANLEENNLPTRAWLTSRIEEDRKILAELDPNDPKHTDKICTIKNRVRILQDAPCVNDDDVVFEAYHFRHEEEQRKSGDPKQGTFNQIYHSRAHDGKKQDLSVDEIIPTRKAPTITSNSSFGDSPQAFFQNVVDQKTALQQKYFNETNGIFTQYLANRAKTYAWRDYWSTKTAFFLGFFGYETEQAKRRRFVTELKKAYESNDSDNLSAMITYGKQEFSPRALPGNKGFKQSLRYFLEQFEQETLKKPSNQAKNS